MQTLDNNAARLTQLGNRNSIEFDQYDDMSWPHNALQTTLFMKQQGDLNQVTSYQNGSRNRIEKGLQKGNRNEMDLVQRSGILNYIVAKQYGDRNELDGDQIGSRNYISGFRGDDFADPSQFFSTFKQDGFKNKSTLLQVGDQNGIHVLQSGNYHTGTVTQTGDMNTTLLYQTH
jgi:hypothetical protein